MTVELTLEQLATIEHALARVSREAIAAPLRATPTGTGSGGRFEVTLQEDSLTVTISGQRFACKPTSFRLLAYLIHRQGRWVRTETLEREVLEAAVQAGASNIRWHVLQARRALGAHGGLLHSDNRLGYMFEFAACARSHCARPPGASVERRD